HCQVPAAFERHVEYQHGTLRICEDLYPLTAQGNVQVLAIGKAAHTMAEALVEQVGELVEGIIVAPTDPAHQLPNFRYFKGGHPVPNQESLRAGRALLRRVTGLDEQALVLYLISGGGSSLAEFPLDAEITLAELKATYEALVLSGAPITAINAIRKHLSAVKGGRLAMAAAPAQQVSILVSDVPDGALDSLASGPTMPDSSTVDDCYRVAAKHELIERFPAPVAELFRGRALVETPKSDHPAFARSRWWPILSNEVAVRAAAAKAAESGFAADVDSSCDDWDYARAADYLLQRVREMRRGVSRACLISGGEITVKVNEGGVGGRNQHFALYCAEKIAGENIAVLSCGTDGVDGNSPAAGAVVDGTTAERARALGLDPLQALAKFDSYSFFQALGDAIETGPTGNNVRDLRVLIAW
ncbi:MAG TPA: DUF4147 domain-containing protein, partial [Terriglobales bacterium]|nr:DUF4147 domain-containing protein [Terriglobales bacterium]